MRRAIPLFAIGLAAAPAHAALPPQYQRQAELLAIISDIGVVDAFGYDGVDAIEIVSPDRYRVRGGDCQLDVSIEDLPSTNGEGWVGPRQFRVVPGQLSCGEEGKSK